jgi:hypothetical protein
MHLSPLPNWEEAFLLGYPRELYVPCRLRQVKNEGKPTFPVRNIAVCWEAVLI